MGNRKYPPLTPKEIEAILIARGFNLHHKNGDHKYYTRIVKGKKRVAQIDMGNSIYTDQFIKLILRQCGMTREEFYCSIKSTSRKIGMQCADKEELENWALA